MSNHFDRLLTEAEKTHALMRELVCTAALADLDEIFWFIAADNPHRARSYVAEIRRRAATSAASRSRRETATICGRAFICLPFGAGS